MIRLATSWFAVITLIVLGIVLGLPVLYIIGAILGGLKLIKLGFVLIAAVLVALASKK